VPDILLELNCPKTYIYLLTYLRFDKIVHGSETIRLTHLKSEQTLKLRLYSVCVKFDAQYLVFHYLIEVKFSCNQTTLKIL
jgi:hypothetical protein